MRKIVAILLLITSLLVLAGCMGKPKAEVSIDYGDSTLYTKEDMDAAIAVIRKEFDTWEGCELHSITYGSDDECSADNIAWMNELEATNDAQETFSQCILFKSNFHSPKNGGGAWNADQEYTDWQWWLARSEGGAWKLMTWGYG
jgi:D-alanyl-D-alanine carboxypeptidase